MEMSLQLGAEPDRSPVGAFLWLRRIVAGVQAVVAVALVLAILLVAAGAVPTLVGYEGLPVLSGSMEPVMHVGSLAVVQPVPAGTLRVGDVVTYRNPQQPDLVVTHRLVEISQDESGRYTYRTKGDANTSDDTVLVDPQAVLGKVIYSIPYVGYLVEFSRHPSGKWALFGIPLFLLALDAGWHTLRGSKAQGEHRPDAAAANVPPLSPSNTATGLTPATAAPAPITSHSNQVSQVTVPWPAPAPPGGGYSEGHPNSHAPFAHPGSPASSTSRLNADGMQLLLETAQEALAAGDHRRAQEVAEAVLAADPRNEAGWLIKAETVTDLDERVRLLETAAFLNPQSGRLARTLGQLRLRQFTRQQGAESRDGGERR